MRSGKSHPIRRPSVADLLDSNVTGSNLQSVIWANTRCPDGTNSDSDGGMCAGYL